MQGDDWSSILSQAIALGCVPVIVQVSQPPDRRDIICSILTVQLLSRVVSRQPASNLLLDAYSTGSLRSTACTTQATVCLPRVSLAAGWLFRQSCKPGQVFSRTAAVHARLGTKGSFRQC
jgi:hypothetical protein